MKVVGLLGKGTGANDFDLAIFIDDDVMGVKVSDFFIDFFELIGCPDHVVEEVPHFRLGEKALHFFSIFNFGLKNIRKVLIFDLG